MVRLTAILLVLLGACSLSAHPFDDRCDMVAELLLLADDDGKEQYMRLQVQYRYETPYASYNEAFLQLDANRDGKVNHTELQARYETLTNDFTASVLLTMGDEAGVLKPRYEQYAFANLDDPDASVNNPGGMPVQDLRIGYFFYFDVQFENSWADGSYPVKFHLANRRIAITDPAEQMRAWDDRGDERRAITSVFYDRTGDRFDRLNFRWEVEEGAATRGTKGLQPAVVVPDVTDPEVVTPDAKGKEQLFETDKERNQQDPDDSIITESFRKLREGDASIWLWLTVLLPLFLFGAYHAVTPGHGKTLVASYLIGTQGRKSDAIFLGLVVTAAHTSGVYLLLGGAWAFREFFPGVLDNPEKQLAEWITLAVGATIFLMGAALVMKRAGGGDHHEHDIFGRHVDGDGHDHGHSHDHAHSHDRGHSHEHSPTPSSADEKSPEDSDVLHEHTHDGHTHSHDGHTHSHEGELDPGKLTRWEILRLGILGGVLPCPSAFVIGLVAVQQQAYGVGLIFVLSFSLGLGMVLAAIGLMLVQGKAYMAEKSKKSKSKLFKLAEAKLPMVGALVITLIGTVMVVLALIRLELIDPSKFAV